MLSLIWLNIGDHNFLIYWGADDIPKKTKWNKIHIDTWSSKISPIQGGHYNIGKFGWNCSIDCGIDACF